MKYLSVEEIKKAFAKHLRKHRGYSVKEAEMAVSDFPDPYTNCYLDEKYIGSFWIDGIEYNKYASNTDLWRAGIHNTPNFFFYTYYRKEDLEGGTVGDYMKARKLFQIEGLDIKDFPLMEYEKNIY